ncbi:RNA-binding protein [Aureimonas fodinaquatilis]|uniref:RNA-binding protein n=1 Tax=Aureimonas fodinaquatilis TaxID=2565783 RepID=A0A5B0DP11_9HYPH|nr:RNA-binding protein [Aureimonas fodinaquatilis]KAA0968577.1 RNA-binding protein [Aureimonas fodinaquatilis]
MTLDEDQEFEEAVVNGRMCILSRQSLPAESLIRFVAGPDGAVVPDLKRHLPGRGVHVEARHSAVAEAARKGLFRRGLKRDVKTGPELADLVDMLLARSCLGAMGLCRKAGQLVTGAAKVDATVRGGHAAGLLHAVDGAADGVRKLESAVRAAEMTGRAARVPSFRLFTSEEMDLALGGMNVIHAAILSGNAGTALLKRLDALAKFRGVSPNCDEGTGAQDSGSNGTAHEQTGHVKHARGTDDRRGTNPAQEAEA